MNSNRLQLSTLVVGLLAVTVHFKTGHSRAFLEPAGVIDACSSDLL
jgi:hypothetical protein